VLRNIYNQKNLTHSQIRFSFLLVYLDTCPQEKYNKNIESHFPTFCDVQLELYQLNYAVFRFTAETCFTVSGRLNANIPAIKCRMETERLFLKRFGALLLTLAIAVSAAACPLPTQAAAPIRGIDVSKYQGNINWTDVKNSGIKFAMIRDGFGGDGNQGVWDEQTDPCFVQNYRGAVNSGLKVGVYHFSYATNTTMASQEADECLHILNGRHLDYPVAYDIEDTDDYHPSELPSGTLGEIVDTFCSKIENAGYKTLVYANKNFFQNHLTSPLVYRHNLWVAQYINASAPDFSNYSMWQYASDGSVPGITGHCDMDYSYVDFSAGGGDTQPMDPMTFNCDTSSYSFGDRISYVYKITTPDIDPPAASSSNPSAVTVSGPRPTRGGYLFTITNVGKGDATITTTASDGRSVAFTAIGTGAAYALKCDTPSYNFGSRSTYYYKITTANPTAPNAESSNPSAVSVSFYKKVSDGYMYCIKNMGTGTATITTTGSDGSTASFVATGTAGTLKCDTPSYTFGARSDYYYKITTADATVPTVKSSNPSAVTVSYDEQLSDGYLFRIHNVGAGIATITTTSASGSSVSFQATGHDATFLKSDTPYYYTMKLGAQYQFKLTGVPGNSYRFACAGDSVIRTVAISYSDGSYYLRIKAVGSGKAGVYAASGSTSQRFGIVTVR
jgi:GH25 family lysozyme M1 (1,4-beta-N-acetylmuramidase)